MIFYEPKTPQFNIIFWQLTRELGKDALKYYAYVGSESASEHTFKISCWHDGLPFDKYHTVYIKVKP